MKIQKGMELALKQQHTYKYTIHCCFMRGVQGYSPDEEFFVDDDDILVTISVPQSTTESSRLPISGPY